MSKYINADDAVKAFEELHGSESTLLNCYNADWIVSFLESQPAADVREIKHGRWIPKGKWSLPECSECGEMLGDDWDDTYEKTPYCPHCGAKMDEEEKE